MKNISFKIFKILLLCLLLISLLLGGCNTAKIDSYISSIDNNDITNNFNQNAELPKNIVLPNDKHSSIFALENDNVFYGTFLNKEASYHILNLSTGEIINYGAIKNHFVSNASFVMHDNSIYFYVTTNSDAVMQNHFCRLDIANEELSIIFTEQNHQTFNYLAVAGGSIFSTNGYLAEDGSGITYLEVLDPKQKTRHTFVEYKIHYSKKEGKVLTNATTFGDNIFAFVQSYEEGEAIPYIYSYDLSGNLVQTIDMRNFSEIFDTAIGELRVIGNYVYIKNISNVALLGKIVDGQFLEIASPREDFSFASNTSMASDELVFFWRNTNFILLLDKETDKLIYKTLPFENGGRSILNITQSKGTLLVYTMDQNNTDDEYTFRIDIDELIDRIE